ncbi:gliding motility lipoprotein GldD [Dyadobacter sp. CY343]|uniref:gliding motility lipoprotein GldD n=1 Tax=Dyadobacter sp. CY343 TaxID=2907299 RepID=UPI001F176EC9|nr:gliding motility lipoprotein GldD [Dyadobacter sp. CY343]MCE7058587.1 gliding motility lipoprotein GldD [Dyadobacter sp. CY343]
MLKRFLLLIVFGLNVLLLSCGDKEKDAGTFAPRPKGFNRINLPTHSYQQLSEEHPYTFQVSRFAKVEPDTFSMAEKHWIFINYPALKANIQITYKAINNDPNRLKSFIDDSYKLAGKHQIRASSIQEQRLLSKSGRTAMMFKIEGDVPSPYQFYTTDSSKHFLRGAIYFPSASKNDSLAPVIDYLQKDMIQLLNTLQWR